MCGNPELSAKISDAGWRIKYPVFLMFGWKLDGSSRFMLRQLLDQRIIQTLNRTIIGMADPETFSVVTDSSQMAALFHRERHQILAGITVKHIQASVVLFSARAVTHNPCGH